MYAQAGYPLALAALARLRARRDARRRPPRRRRRAAPHVALVVAAHAEEDVIAAKVANARALDWPADRLTVVVACDGSPDATPRRAREAGADLVLELPWGGKVRAQDAAVDATDAPLLAFSDANALWEPGALRALVAALERGRRRLRLRQRELRAHPSGHRQGGTNQEGLYWRYEMAIRARESRAGLGHRRQRRDLRGAARRPTPRVDPVMGHDLSFPFTLVRRGWRAVVRPRGPGDREDGPHGRGRVARASGG